MQIASVAVSMKPKRDDGQPVECMRLGEVIY